MKSTKHPRHNGVLIFTSGALGGSCADSSKISCGFGGAPGALRGRSWRPKRPKSSQNVTFIVKFGFLGSGEHPSEATSHTVILFVSFDGKRKKTKKPTRLISTSHSVSFAGTKSRVRTLSAPELRLSMFQRSRNLNAT